MIAIGGATRHPLHTAPLGPLDTIPAPVDFVKWSTWRISLPKDDIASGRNVKKDRHRQTVVAFHVNKERAFAPLQVQCAFVFPRTPADGVVMRCAATRRLGEYLDPDPTRVGCGVAKAPAKLVLDPQLPF